MSEDIVERHTPGPWAVEDSTVIWSTVQDPPETSYDLGTPIAEVRTMKSLLGPAYSRETVAANARLISAAPDMLEALERFVEDCSNEECEFCIKARSAIAKARGEK